MPFRNYDSNKIVIDQELSIDFCDEGPWRSYLLITEGYDFDQLTAEAYISEIDQDGGELDSYSIDDAPSDVGECAIELIKSIMGGQ